jgi:hypothetical protein
VNRKPLSAVAIPLARHPARMVFPNSAHAAAGILLIANGEFVTVAEDRGVRNANVARSLVRAPIVRGLDAPRLSFILDGEAFRIRVRTEEDTLFSATSQDSATRQLTRLSGLTAALCCHSRAAGKSRRETALT